MNNIFLEEISCSRVFQHPDFNSFNTEVLNHFHASSTLQFQYQLKKRLKNAINQSDLVQNVSAFATNSMHAPLDLDRERRRIGI